MMDCSLLRSRWNCLISSQSSVYIRAAGDGATLTSSSPAKGSKAGKRASAGPGSGGTSATQAAAMGPDDIPVRFGGCSFVFKDVLHLLGANDKGNFECFCIVKNDDGATSPGAGGRAGSPSKKAGAKKGAAAQQNIANSPNKLDSASHASATSMAVKAVPCSGKSPSARTLFAIGTATASHTNSGTIAASSSNGKTLCDSFFASQLITSVFMHGGIQHSALNGTDVGNTAGSSGTPPAGLDDLWEFRCHQMAWQAVAVRPPLIAKRYCHCLIHAHGRLYIFGGIDARTNNVLGDFWVLDDSSSNGKRWTPVIPHGSCSTGSMTGVDDHTVMSLQRPCARSHHCMAAAPDGCILLHGGISATNEVLNDLWCVRVSHEASLSGMYSGEVVVQVSKSPPPLVVWRRVELPGESIPRRLGSSLIVSPLPRDAGASPTGRVVNFLLPTVKAPQFLVLFCGGWDVESLSPFGAQPAGNRDATSRPQATENENALLQQAASTVFSAAGSFRFGSFRGDDGSMSGRRSIAERLPQALTSQRRASSIAPPSDGPSENAVYGTADDRRPGLPNADATTNSIVVAFSASLSSWQAVGDDAEDGATRQLSDRSSNTGKGVVELEVPVETANSENSESDTTNGARTSPPPKLPAGVVTSRSRVLHSQRAVIANSAGSLSHSTFARAVSRSQLIVDAPSLASLQVQLCPPHLLLRKIDTDVVLPQRNLKPQESEGAPDRHRSQSSPVLDPSALATSRRGEFGGFDEPQVAVRSHLTPTSTMQGCWCRAPTATSKLGASAAEEVLMFFGGNMGPMVACGDVWRCRLELAPEMTELEATLPFGSL